MERELFWFDGQRSDTFGLHLQKPITFSSPTPRIETVSLPGKNGDLHFYDGAFNNVEGNAECFSLQEQDIDKAIATIARWTLLHPGYHRLETTEEPEIYRMAAVVSGPETEIRMRVLAPFTLKFSCIPQRFLKSGERVIRLQKSGTKLINPGFPSLPLITVTGKGSGSLSINYMTVSFKDSFYGPVTLDCDTQNAYYGAENKNKEISAPVFPTLPAGESTVSWSGGIERVEIVPRWWIV